MSVIAPRAARTRTRVRRRMGTMAAPLGRLASRMRTGAARESRRRRLLWAVAALVVVAGPIVVDLTRASGFTARVHIVPVPASPFPATADPAYYRRLLKDRELHREMRRHVGKLADDGSFRSIRIGPSPRGSVIVGATLARPSDARDFINALGPQLAVASWRQVLRSSARAVLRIRGKLAGHLSALKRRRLKVRLVPMQARARDATSRIVIARYSRRPPLHRWSDRIVDALPGSFPGRPSAVWAGLAGLLVAATLWAIGLTLVPPGGRR